jgi:transposase
MTDSRDRSVVASTLMSWVRQAERDGGRRPGVTTDERARFMQLERENAVLPG